MEGAHEGSRPGKSEHQPAALHQSCCFSEQKGELKYQGSGLIGGVPHLNGRWQRDILEAGDLAVPALPSEKKGAPPDQAAQRGWLPFLTSPRRQAAGSSLSHLSSRRSLAPAHPVGTLRGLLPRQSGAPYWSWVFRISVSSLHLFRPPCLLFTPCSWALSAFLGVVVSFWFQISGSVCFSCYLSVFFELAPWS